MNLKRAFLILLTAAIIMPGIALAQDVPPPVTARFLVEKAFTDGNPGEVEVTITCNTGIPLVQSAMISFGNPVAFVVEELIIVDAGPDGATNCEIVEDGENGYVANYDNQDADSLVSCLFSALDDNLGEGNLCEITNSPAPVTVAVTKIWELTGAVGEDVDTDIYISARSSAVITDGYVCGYDNQQIPDEWCKDMHFDGPATDTETLQVVPHFEGATVFLHEDIYDSAVESSNTCGFEMSGQVTVFPGQGAACTFTNTVFFEGIPTLSQYGLAIMALLMLGVGFVGFRRFV